MPTSRLVTMAFFFIFGATGSFAKTLLDRNNCLEDLKFVAKDLLYEQLIQLVQLLTQKDLKCLFKEAESLGAPSIDFFSPPITGESTQVPAVLFGKNSLRVMNTFEKHLFTGVDENGADYIYGYNFHKAMAFTSRGVFKVIPRPNAILLDFDADAAKKNRDEFGERHNAKTLTKNLSSKLFFGSNTKDYCRRLIYDERTLKDIVVVCQGYRDFFRDRRPFIWDVLIRKW